MLNVYNYFIGSSDTKKLQKFVAHNPEELSTIYGHIVSLSKKTPLFLLDISEVNQLYAINVKESALLLQAQANELADPNSSVFTPETLVSEFPELVSVEPLRSGTIKLPHELTVKVLQLASEQKNIGFDLPSQETGLPPGEYRFAIEKSEQLYEFPYTLVKKQTNMEFQTKLADFINKAGIGIHAYIQSNPDHTTSALTLENQKHRKGDSGSFHIYDINQSRSKHSSGITAFLGLDNLIMQPTMARFQLNGKELTSNINHYIYNEKIDLQFHQTSETPVLIHNVPDKKNIKEKINILIEAYNRLVQTASERKNNRRSSKLINELHKVTEKYSEDLSTCGIIKDSSALLNLDTTLFDSAFSTGKVETIIKTEAGICTDLSDRAGKIALNPMDYLDKIIVTYPDLSPAGYPSPYITSIYSGMLFNYYC